MGRHPYAEVEEVKSFVTQTKCAKTLGNDEVVTMLEKVQRERSNEQGVYHVPKNHANEQSITTKVFQVYYWSINNEQRRC